MSFKVLGTTLIRGLKVSVGRGESERKQKDLSNIIDSSHFSTLLVGWFSFI